MINKVWEYRVEVMLNEEYFREGVSSKDGTGSEKAEFQTEEDRQSF